MASRSTYETALARVQDLTAEVKNAQELVADVLKERESSIRGLEDTPGDPELTALLEYIEEQLPQLNATLESQKRALEKAQHTLAALPKPQTSRAAGALPANNSSTLIGTNETATAVTTDHAEPPAPTSKQERVFNVNEKIMAYHPDDFGQARKLKPGKVLMRTTRDGNTYYLVQFIGKDYLLPDGTLKNERHELPSWEVKPNFAADKARAEAKRKAEEKAAAAAAAAAVEPTINQSTGSVLSGPASINLDLLNRQPGSSEGAAKSDSHKKRKLENSKAYNERANNWKNFQAHGKVNKRAKTESMFRTEEGNLNARVGVIGSGKAMTQDRTRVKHVFKPEHDEDDDDY